MTSSIAFEARTAIGKTIQTFSDEDLARAWWKSEAAQKLPGCYLVEVCEVHQVTVTRLPVRRRNHLRLAS